LPSKFLLAVNRAIRSEIEYISRLQAPGPGYTFPRAYTVFRLKVKEDDLLLLRFGLSFRAFTA